MDNKAKATPPTQAQTPPTSQVANPNQTEVGFTLSIRQFLIHADGLPSVKVNDLVESETGGKGWINTIHSDRVSILMLDDVPIEPRTMFKKSGSKLTISPSDALLGRAISPMGVPIDGKGPINNTTGLKSVDLDSEAVGIGKRQFIQEQFTTGVTLVDTLIPIGKGQRELILGDARSGKTRFLVDTVNNQKNTGTIVIYCLIGKPTTSVRNLMNILEANKCWSYTVMIAASSTDLPPLAYIAPQTALTIAEHFQRQGKDVLVILDDLGNHAKFYREISLLSDKYPGRESYPGDMFYQHSHLLERAGKFTKEMGGGSITLLPIIEINLNDYTTVIPNNLMSMTDGHLLFKSDLFNTGQYPAIDISLSVSRVGKQTQNRVQNAIGAKVKQVLSQAQEFETIARFSSELPQETQVILRQKDLILELIKQDPLTFMSLDLQTCMLAMVFTTYLKFKEPTWLKINKSKLITAFNKEAELIAIVKSTTKFKSEEELISKLEALNILFQHHVG